MSTESPSTTDRLAEIEARAENRVPGHWHAVSIEFRGQTSHSVKSNVGSVLAHTGYGPVGGSSHANAEFMANAPADIEFLLEENARLRARLDTAEGQLATARERFELERVAALIDPEAWRHIDPHSAELFEEMDTRAEYEANFAEAVRQRREPSLTAAERVIALFKGSRALGLDGEGSR